VRVAVLFLLCAPVLGCGLYAGGARAADDGTDGGPSPPPHNDASAGADVSDEPPPAPPCVAKGTACIDALASGWTPLAFASTRAAKCPQAYTEQDLIGDAVANVGACGCACTPSVADPPSCSQGSITAQIGQSQCNQMGPTYAINGPGCVAYGPATIAPVALLKPIAAHEGACTSSSAADTSKLTARDVRACAPPSACLEDVCEGTAPVGFAACVAHDGDVPCPGTPFVARTLTGTQANLGCGGCAGCSNTVTCSNASMHFFVDGFCAVPLASRKADGNCNPLASGFAGTATGYKYDVTMNAQCAALSAPTSSVNVAGARTVCCR
jgi:hypothetical protein